MVALSHHEGRCCPLDHLHSPESSELFQVTNPVLLSSLSICLHHSPPRLGSFCKPTSWFLSAPPTLFQIPKPYFSLYRVLDRWCPRTRPTHSTTSVLGTGWEAMTENRPKQIQLLVPFPPSLPSSFFLSLFQMFSQPKASLPRSF